MLVNIILWIIFGAIVGWVASVIMNTDEEQGFGTNIFVGILGALVGGYLVDVFGGPSVNDFSIWGLIVSIIGAVILLGVVRMFRRRTH